MMMIERIRKPALTSHSSKPNTKPALHHHSSRPRMKSESMSTSPSKPEPMQVPDSEPMATQEPFP